MAKRVTVILGGYLAACLVAGLVYSTALALKYSDGVGKGAGLIIAATIFIGFYVATLALLPALLGIIYAERTGVSSIMYYVVGGALAGSVSYGLYALLLIWTAGTAKGFVSGDPSHFLFFWLVLFGAPGLAGGLVYWLVAGRKAGQWH